MRARNENANKCAIDFYTVSVRWKHADRTLTERSEIATNTQRARREIDTFLSTNVSVLWTFRQRTPTAPRTRGTFAQRVHSMLAEYGPYVGKRREFLCMHKISRRTQRAQTYECVWQRVLNARSTTSRRAADVHQLRVRYSFVPHTMRARNENANKCAIDFYTVSVRWKHADRTLTERSELATNTRIAQPPPDVLPTCISVWQKVVIRRHTQS